MPTARKGRQTPTQEVTLRYRKSLGKEAAETYERTGRRLMRWQRLLLSNMLAHDNSHRSLWTHTKFGYEVPRRNGKGEVLLVRELFGLLRGERILHTAHRTTTSHSAWERMCSLLSEAGYQYDSYKAYGLESISSQSFSGKINFRTRSAKGGLGEGYDLLVIDEAQEYTDDQASALKYVVTDSKNPQTILCGTPPTAVSAGTVFMKLREAALKGEGGNTGWAEWSVSGMTDPQDREAWYETNPSLGSTLTERAIADEISSDNIDFNIQRLGLWLRYNQKSAISENEWELLRVDAPPKLSGKLHVGIKFAHSGKTAAMAIAVRTEDGQIFLEAIDVRPLSAGYYWLLDFLAQADIRAVIVDGANGQQALADAMKAMKLKAPLLPTVKDVIAAGAGFEQDIYQRRICHMGQASLAQSVTNCDHRAIGANGGFGYRSIVEDVEVSLLEAAVLAHWSCAQTKERKAQKISY